MKPSLRDTNILTAYLKGHSGVISFMEQHLKDAGRPSLSIITYYELLRGFKELVRDREKKLRQFEDLVDRLHLRMLMRHVADLGADLYAHLRRQGKPLEDADILIAATALAYELVTDNERHFQRVPNLEVENWLRR